MKELEKLNETMTMIAEKLTILAMPEHMRSKQFEYFRAKRLKTSYLNLLKMLEENSDSMPETRKQFDYYSQKCNKLLEEGCEDL